MTIMFDKVEIISKNYMRQIWSYISLPSLWRNFRKHSDVFILFDKSKIIFVKFEIISENDVWHLWPDDLRLPAGLWPLHSPRGNCLWLCFVFCGGATFQFCYHLNNPHSNICGDLSKLPNLVKNLRLEQMTLLTRGELL